jgi:hypothetical protein
MSPPVETTSWCNKEPPAIMDNFSLAQDGLKTGYESHWRRRVDIKMPSIG